MAWLLWPFAAGWSLLGFLLKLTGRLVGVLLGLVLMIAGLALTLTLIAAPVGIPFSVLGLLVLLRSVF